MISSKERAFLKRVIATESPVFQVGKEGTSQNNIEGVEQALIARELIKINVLQNCDMVAKEVAIEISSALNCEVVAVIGRKVVLYKFNPKLTKHVLDNFKN